VSDKKWKDGYGRNVCEDMEGRYVDTGRDCSVMFILDAGFIDVRLDRRQSFCSRLIVKLQ
jgi:hypothetical protein